jgi:hypothetical protein
MRSGQNVPTGANCTAPPSAPSGVTVGQSAQTVTVNWAPPAAGDVITTYLIEARQPQDAKPTTFIAAGTATSYQRQAPPAVYHVRVMARNACGTSAPSSEVTVTVN